MGKTLDAMRAALERKHAVQPKPNEAIHHAPIAVPTVTVPFTTVVIDDRKPTTSTAARPKPKPYLSYRCGHTTGVKEFGDLDCASCRQKIRSARKARRRAAKAAAKAAAHAALAAKPPVPVYLLPDGSASFLRHTGGIWKGRMRVPGVPTSFVATADTERKCRHELHTAYQQFMAANAKTG